MSEWYFLARIDVRDVMVALGNSKIARILRDYSALLGVSGANPFKAKAYRRAAESIDALPTSVQEFLSTGHDLRDLPGVGEGISRVIQEILQTGEFKQAEALSTTLDPALVELAANPGLNARHITRAYRKLKINSLDELRGHLAAGELQDKLGARLDFQLRQGLSDRPRMLFKRGWALAVTIRNFIQQQPGVSRAELVGSLRRKQETIGDINILVTGSRRDDLFDELRQWGNLEECQQVDNDTFIGQVSSGLAVSVVWSPRQLWGWNLLQWTGSGEHLRELSKVAEELGMEFTQQELQSHGIRLTTEAAIYHALHLDYIEPELREGRHEVVDARHGTLPRLVRLADIKGDLHMHTVSSDGTNTLDELVVAARDRGYRYIAITDHSRSLRIANGLSVERLLQQLDEIDDLNSRVEDVTVLKSAEVDILADGSLDYPDDVLRLLDLTICSIHSKFSLSREEQTTRLLRAMDNPYCSILGHPTGRLLLNRPGYEIDIERVLRHAKATGCCVEINANPNRLDLSDEAAAMAKEIGVKVAVNTDAHAIQELDFMPFGINQARRAGLSGQDVLNTLSLAGLKRTLKRST